MELNHFKQKEFNQIEKLSPLQFLFICEVNAKLGHEFSCYLSIIQKYISHLSNDDLDLILNLENALYIHFIKYFETEDAYNDFFEIFAEKYKSVKQFNQKSGNKGILFFTHTPYFHGSHKSFI